jgi:MoxR-like ATPase
MVAGIREEMSKVIVGQRYMVDRLLIGLLARGHLLLEGVPGLAKTTAIKSLAGALDLDFSRVQFTPDLLPADVVGTQIYSPRDGNFSTHQGPIFANLVLADEINRAPAKVQSALLEAMQERQVTIGDQTFELPDPFLVLATQNPIEQEGTYPLPEAQVDRFLMKLRVGYPTKTEEREIMRRAFLPAPELNAVCDAASLLEAQDLVRRILAKDSVADYVVDLVHATRDPDAVPGLGGSGMGRFIEFGASPRASISLLAAGRAHAFLDGRACVPPDDIKAVGPDVLRHRLVLSYEAEAEELDPDAVLAEIFQKVDIP